MALILKDIIDSYKMEDGDRIVRIAYFKWLYASSLRHTMFAIWLWRMNAYVNTVLTPTESAECKWNSTVNLKGVYRIAFQRTTTLNYKLEILSDNLTIRALLNPSNLHRISV